MNSLLFLFLFSAGATIVVASYLPGKQNLELEESVPYIYGGVNTTIFAHPYLAAVHRNNYTANKSHLLCTGTIVSKKWVLVPSDCIFQVNLNYITVVVGSTDGVTGDQYTVGEKTVNFSLALLKIDGKFNWSEKTRSVSIPQTPLQTNKRLTVMGYEQAGNGSFGLVEGVMAQMDMDRCRNLYQDFVPVTDWTTFELCAYNRWKVTICPNSSAAHFGAPLINQGTVYGLDSLPQAAAPLYTLDCSPNALPSVYANVFEARGWILDTLENGSEANNFYPS